MPRPFLDLNASRARATSLTVTLVLALAAGMSGCKQTEAPAASASKPDPDLVQVGDGLVQQLKVVPVGTVAVSHVERIAGRIDFDEQRVLRIGSAVTGRVTDLHAKLGDGVQAGDLLAQLHSSELGTSQLAYLRARQQAELHRRNVERARLLLSADVIGSAELQRRESELSIAEAEMRAGVDQLRVLGMTPRAIESIVKSGAINSTSQVSASANGVIVERKVALGQVIQPSDALFTIADLSRLWVVAQVPEQQIAGIDVGQMVSIEVPALGNAKLDGKLVFVSDVVNAENRTVTVRTEVDNRERKLKPAMLATMLIRSKAVERLAVPLAAVIRENGEEHVLKELAPGKYRLAKVKLAAEQEGVRAVESGLVAGERIVVDGAFHLNNERKRKLLGD